MGAEDHFFPRDKNEANGDVLPKDRSGIDDFHLGRSEGVIAEEEGRRKAAEEAKSARAAEEASHTLSDEHSGRDERVKSAADARGGEGGAEAEEEMDERPDMRSEYNLHGFELTSDDRSNLERITDRGRAAFDGLLDIRKIDRVAARFGMKFDQHFLDKSNENTKELNVKVAHIDDKIRLFNQRNGVAATGASNGFLAERLVEARNENIDKLNRERARLMAKIGEHEADAKASEVTRNKYVDWMIRRNNEKIAPLEGHKMRLREDLREFDEEHRPLTVHFQAVAAEVESFEKQKVNGIKEAEEAGLSKKEVKEEIKKFDAKIKRRRDVLKEWDDIKRQRARLEQKIAQVSAEIAKIDRKKEYEAIKNKKPYIVTPQAEAAAGGGLGDGNQGPTGPDGHLLAEEETGREGAETRFGVGDMLELWKKSFSEKVNEGFKIEKAIEEGEFTSAEGEQLTIAGFKQKLRVYYGERFPGATALLVNINEAIDGFGGNQEEFRAALQELDASRQENQEAPKLWIQDAIINWNGFLNTQFDSEFRNEPELRGKIIMNPGEFVNKDGVPQEVDAEELREVIGNYYQNKPEVDTNTKRRLEQEYQNFLERNDAN